MTCREMTSFLEEYMAGELPDAVRLEVVKHTSDCGVGLGSVAQYRPTGRAAGALAAEPPHPLPPALVAAILAAVQKDDRKA
jgi:hypothetical protein